jgi:hypothetical protein
MICSMTISLAQGHGRIPPMAEPTNAAIMGELKKLGGLVRTIDRRLKTVEADMALLRSAYANQGKTIGDLLRSTPLPPPRPEEPDPDEETDPSMEISDFPEE